MAKSDNNVRYLIFDAEAIADGDLIVRVRYPNDDLAPAEAIAKYQAELLEQRGSDVLPVTFMLPIAVAVAKVGPDFRLQDLAVLDAPEYRPAEITRRFWNGWEHYRRPTLVTFNGRGYDLPLLETAAYRYGLSLPNWYKMNARNFEQPRYRYNQDAHLDLMDLLSNFGASRLTGGLNLLANLIGKPGKTGVDGSMVQGMHDEGRTDEINDYCRCDVLDTYFVFLRSQVLVGKLPLGDEQKIVDETKTWLESQAGESPAFAHYLEHWGDWEPPSA